MNKSNLSSNVLWMAVGLIGTLTVVALLALGIVLITSRQGEPAPAPTPTEAAQATLAPVALLPSATLMPTPLPIPPTETATPTGPVIYKVKPGDTLLGIALEYGVTVEDIQRANNMDLTNIMIQPDQELIIPVNPPPAEPTVTSEATPIITSTSQPNPVASTSAQGTLYACPANATERELSLPGDPIRLALSGDQAYFIAGGDLYAAAINELAGAGPLAPSNVMPSERKIGKYTIQELVHVAVDPDTGDLILLDKSDDIYRRTLSGEWRMDFAVAPIPNQYPDPQYLAVQAFGGNVYALDADLSHIWKFAPGETLPVSYYAGGDVATGMDMVIPTTGAGNGAIFVLTREGRAIKFMGSQRDGSFSLPAEVGSIPWPGQILATDKYVIVVDSEGRRVIGLDAASGQIAWQAIFRFQGMQRLRSAAINGDTLYALSGRKLYVAKLSSPGSDCPQVSYDNTIYFNGVDVRAVTVGFKMPFPGAVLPSRPRSYPGARRLYRYGIHQGLDLYSTDVPGLGVGSPVLAIADGTISRADTDYAEMTRQEYDDVIKRTETEHQTPPDLFDKLLGRQVRILHSYGVESHYAHLSAIGPDVTKDAVVKQGDQVGKVGVSGTSSGAYGTEEGAHLHVDIWIGGHYLGQGLSLYETMRLWQAVFEQ